jgi:hypothetical protein
MRRNVGFFLWRRQRKIKETDLLFLAKKYLLRRCLDYPSKHLYSISLAPSQSTSSISHHHHHHHHDWSEPRWSSIFDLRRRCSRPCLLYGVAFSYFADLLRIIIAVHFVCDEHNNSYDDVCWDDQLSEWVFYCSVWLYVMIVRPRTINNWKRIDLRLMWKRSSYYECIIIINIIIITSWYFEVY